MHVSLTRMTIPTEPIGASQPPELIAGCRPQPQGSWPATSSRHLTGDRAFGDTLAQFEATGSPVVH